MRFLLVIVAVLAGCASTEADEKLQTQPSQQGVSPDVDRVTQPASEENFELHDSLLPYGTLADWAMVLVTAAGVGVAWRTLDNLARQTSIAKTSADAAKVTADSVLMAERAYISMSHLPPGLVPSPPVNGDITVRCGIAVENKGNTPARVIDAQIFATGRSGSLPEAPPYNVPDTPSSTAYLVKDEKFHINGEFHFSESMWQEILGGQRTLWLLGYVDYSDVFDRKYRAGYARRYAPAAPPNNNLPFETKEGYNYDKALT